ncbi:MAG: hypothetical protein OEW37_10670, partial [Rhodospirillaceae bacterium]|nr:hypothetical protein [Rhodospirillaceae bacterium]
MAQHREDLFLHVVKNLNFGNVQDELSSLLHDCIVASRATGNQSELSLKLKIKPIGQTGQYEIIDSTTHKLAQAAKPSTLMFGTPDGNLTRENP